MFPHDILSWFHWFYKCNKSMQAAHWNSAFRNYEGLIKAPPKLFCTLLQEMGFKAAFEHQSLAYFFSNVFYIIFRYYTLIYSIILPIII